MTKTMQNMIEVEKLREYLQKLIEEKSEIIDTEVLQVSRMLDVLLNEYYNLSKRKDGNS